MFKSVTTKKKLYFNEVMRLHLKEGLGAIRISRLVPLDPSTITRWIDIFAKDKKLVPVGEDMKKSQTKPSGRDEAEDAENVEALKKRVKELEAQLLKAEIKAEFYDEMINVAEAKFKIQIRKKAGAKQ